MFKEQQIKLTIMKIRYFNNESLNTKNKSINDGH